MLWWDRLVLEKTIGVLSRWLGLRRATFDTTDQEDVCMSRAPDVGGVSYGLGVLIPLESSCRCKQVI